MRAPRSSCAADEGLRTGLNFDKNQNILTIADNAVVNVDADEKGAGAMHVTAGGLEFRRNEHLCASIAR